MCEQQAVVCRLCCTVCGNTVLLSVVVLQRALRPVLLKPLSSSESMLPNSVLQNSKRFHCPAKAALLYAETVYRVLVATFQGFLFSYCSTCVVMTLRGCGRHQCMAGVLACIQFCLSLLSTPLIVLSPAVATHMASHAENIGSSRCAYAASIGCDTGTQNSFVARARVHG